MVAPHPYAPAQLRKQHRAFVKLAIKATGRPESMVKKS
jgi:hypothetical protein